MTKFRYHGKDRAFAASMGHAPGPGGYNAFLQSDDEIRASTHEGDPNVNRYPNGTDFSDTPPPKGPAVDTSNDD